MLGNKTSKDTLYAKLHFFMPKNIYVIYPYRVIRNKTNYREGMTKYTIKRTLKLHQIIYVWYDMVYKLDL